MGNLQKEKKTLKRFNSSIPIVDQLHVLFHSLVCRVLGKIFN